MTSEQAGKLITFGQMALEQGWYDQARDYFEQALVLDATNREAMKGLARANEVLSRRMPTPVEPTRAEPVEPPRKVSIEPTKPEVEPAKPERADQLVSMLEGKRLWVALAVVIPVLLLVLSVAYQRAQVAQRETTRVTEAIPTPQADYARVYETQAAQREATRTAEATLTPKPTKTPVPPRSTPVPPTATPTPGLSAEEQAYVAEMKEILWDYTVYLGRLGELTGEVGRYPWLFSDAQWRSEVGWVLAAFSVRGEKLRALEPPPRYRGSHQDYVQMSRHYDSMCDLITQSIDELNTDKMDKAMEEMNIAGDYFEQGIAKFQQESQLE